jgi:hypothetical protein
MPLTRRYPTQVNDNELGDLEFRLIMGRRKRWSKKAFLLINTEASCGYVTTLISKRQMRPVWRERKEIEANLESPKLFSTRIQTSRVDPMVALREE